MVASYTILNGQRENGVTVVIGSIDTVHKGRARFGAATGQAVAGLAVDLK